MDPDLFPSCHCECPGPIVTAEGENRNFIDVLMWTKDSGNGRQFLLRWLDMDQRLIWLPWHNSSQIQKAYMDWLKQKQ